MQAHNRGLKTTLAERERERNKNYTFLGNAERQTDRKGPIKQARENRETERDTDAMIHRSRVGERVISTCFRVNMRLRVSNIKEKIHCFLQSQVR